jgi:ubiquinone/menaquinone biosynthesis C-methylase UbiE
MNQSMQTTARPEWDYSSLASSYEDRAPYHPDLAHQAIRVTGITQGERLADMGAGTGRIAHAFAELGLRVDAVEPCAEMAAIGREMTARLPVAWHSARAESSGLADAAYAAVCFGSSFNVVDAHPALAESARILGADGKLIVVYNHRDLDDPLQLAIEARIRSIVPDFSYGARRQDPGPEIESGGLFRLQSKRELGFRHRTSRQAFVNAFRAHATLIRQASDRMPQIIDAISEIALSHCLADGSVEIPFHTRIWFAQRSR